MYLPSHFQETRVDVMHDLMRAHPLATLVTFGGDGIIANHIPMVLHADASEHGVLRGHVARPNPFWKNLDPSVEALAVFQGPHHFITPTWYPSKQENGKVVPTWNYAVVHAHGPLIIIDDADWLLEQVNSLTSEHESARDRPWAVSDAPANYIEAMLKGIIGLELPINHLDGKWKVSQNRDRKDREGVAQGLKQEGTASSIQMAELIGR